MKLLTTAEVAERLGVHRSRVNALITSKRLPAQKFGKTYLIDENDLKLVEDRKVGRPRKTTDTRHTMSKRDAGPSSTGPASKAENKAAAARKK